MSWASASATTTPHPEVPPRPVAAATPAPTPGKGKRKVTSAKKGRGKGKGARRSSSSGSNGSGSGSGGGAGNGGVGTPGRVGTKSQPMTAEERRLCNVITDKIVKDPLAADYLPPVLPMLPDDETRAVYKRVVKRPTHVLKVQVRTTSPRSRVSCWHA